MAKGGNGNGGGGSQDPKIIDQSFATLENPLDGTSLGFVTADVRPSKATWSIVSGNDDGAYYIDPITGELLLVDGGAVDYEAEQARDLIVQVTENGKNDYTATVTINVSDVNEAPVVEAATFSVAEDQTSIGTVSASDPDDDPVSYAITDGNLDGLFEIDANGNITLAASKSLDYETTQQHVLQVTATDGGGLSDTASVTVNVTDVNEAPFVIDLTTLSSAEGFIIQGDWGRHQAGHSVSSAGDVNGDGFEDLIVGAPLGDGGDRAGEAYVVFGSNSGFGATDSTGRQVLDLTTLSSAEGFIIQGDAA